MINNHTIINRHKFVFDFPMSPKHGEFKGAIDGRELKNVSAVLIRADVRGYTNVTVEMQAGSAVELVGHLIMHIPTDEKTDNLFANLMYQAGFEIDPESKDSLPDLKDEETRKAVAKMGRLFIQKVIESFSHGSVIIPE